MTTVQHAIDTLEDLRRDWLSALHAELPDAISLRHLLHAQPRLSGDEEHGYRIVSDYPEAWRDWRASYEVDGVRYETEIDDMPRD